MSDDEKAFLAAIPHRAADDAPRLAYADWLMENGQEDRGQFIRVQCTHPMWYDDEEWQEHFGASPYPLEFVQSLDWLKSEAATKDFGPPSDAARPWNRRNARGIVGSYARGFIDSLTMTWAECRVALDAIRSERFVRKVKLTSEPETLEGEDPETGEGWIMLRGGPRRERINSTDLQVDEAVLESLLLLEWPDVEFDLPDS